MSSGKSGSNLTITGAVSGAAVPKPGGSSDYHGSWSGGSRESVQEKNIAKDVSVLQDSKAIGTDI